MMTWWWQIMTEVKHCSIVFISIRRTRIRDQNRSMESGLYHLPWEQTAHADYCPCVGRMDLLSGASCSTPNREFCESWTGGRKNGTAEI